MWLGYCWRLLTAVFAPILLSAFIYIWLIVHNVESDKVDLSFTLHLKHEDDQFFFHSPVLFIPFNFHLVSHQEMLFFLLANLCDYGLPEPCSKLLTVLGQENCMWNTDIWNSMHFEHWKVGEENYPEEISSKSISLKSAFLSWCWLFQSRFEIMWELQVKLVLSTSGVLLLIVVCLLLLFFFCFRRIFTRSS